MVKIEGSLENCNLSPDCIAEIYSGGGGLLPTGESGTFNVPIDGREVAIFFKALPQEDSVLSLSSSYLSSIGIDTVGLEIKATGIRNNISDSVLGKVRSTSEVLIRKGGLRIVVRKRFDIIVREYYFWAYAHEEKRYPA